MTRETIFLDLDGPILDGKERHYFCYKKIVSEFGYNPIPIDRYWDLKRDKIDRKALLTHSGAQKEYDRFLQAWLETIESHEALRLDRVQHGAVEKLQEFKKEGIHLILVTMRKKAEAVLDQLEWTGVGKFLDDVLVCNHAHGGSGKASAVQKKFPDMKMDTSLWIGDTEIDWEAARNLGVPVVLVTNGLRSEKVLRPLGVPLLPSLAAIE